MKHGICTRVKPLMIVDGLIAGAAVIACSASPAAPVPDDSASETDASVKQTNRAVYDPETGTCSAAGNLAEGRILHTATLLDDGRVLVTGSVGPIVTTELYDPESNI